MSHVFANETNKVLVAGMTPNYRTLVTGHLRKAGFKSVTTAANLKFARGILESDVIDWLIIGMSWKEDINGLNLLKLIRETPELSHVKVSIMVGEDEYQYAGRLMELGALSFHELATLSVEFEEELKELLQEIDRTKGDFCAAASMYVKRYCLKSEHYKDLLEFCHNRVKVEAGNPEALLELAEAHFFMNQKSKGLQLLEQVTRMAPNLQGRIKQVRSEHGLPEFTITQDISIGLFDEKTIAVLEPSEKELNWLETTLKSFGFKSVKIFRTTKELGAWVKSGHQPDLLIMEWSLPDFPAPIFIQRFMVRVKKDVPIIVINKHISESETPFLSDLGVWDHIQKPITQESLLTSLLTVVREENEPDTPRTLLRKIQRYLSDDHTREARILKERYDRNHLVTNGDSMSLEAEILFAEERFEDARDLSLKALKEPTDTLRILNTLGMSYMKLGDHTNALKCLESAQVISPFHIGRLCAIAETHLGLKDDQKFEKTMKDAKVLDEENPHVIQTEAKEAIVKGQKEKAMELMNKLPALKKVISYVNNRAVVAIQCGQFEEGIALYHEALAALPATKKELRSIVCRNMGLAFARNQQLTDAKDSLELALDCNNKKRIAQTKDLIARINKAIKLGKKLEISSPQQSKKRTSSGMDRHLDQALLYSKSFSRQDKCCLGLFISREGKVSTSDIEKKPVHFKKRPPFKRDLNFVKWGKAS